MEMWSFTKKGDDGTSLLIGNDNIPKSDVVFDLIGTIDELSAFIGITISHLEEPEYRRILKGIQAELSHIMGDISGFSDKTNSKKFDLGKAIKRLENQIQVHEEKLNNPERFIPPGNSKEGSFLDLDRVVARRAERVCIRWKLKYEIRSHDYCIYLNRLSSLFFILRLVFDGRGTT